MDVKYVNAITILWEKDDKMTMVLHCDDWDFKIAVKGEAKEIALDFFRKFNEDEDIEVSSDDIISAFNSVNPEDYKIL